MMRTIDFLNQLYPLGIPSTLSLELRVEIDGLVSRSFHHTLESAIGAILPIYHLARNVWFGPGLRRGTTGRDVDIVSIPALWCDCDAKCFLEPTVEAAYGCLLMMEPKPSFFVNTGHGVQGYWLLDEPAKGNVAEASSAMRWIKERLSASATKPIDSVHNPSRVMRLPNTWNRKQDPAVISRAYQTTPQSNPTVYSLSDFGRTAPSAIDNILSSTQTITPSSETPHHLLDKAESSGLPSWVSQALYKPEFFYHGDGSRLDWRVVRELLRHLTPGEVETVWIKTPLGNRPGDSKVQIRQDYRHRTIRKALASLQEGD